ncbi:SDR family oxidoreductase [Hoyosella sp. YIM 151337]|uniref:SDR family NAD(P)-dependent oxidoreductase n=1 Tax=Hoyosella sp. YIM 151337 TaxID=2992742 RepID=UPI00223561B1|nr:SDR family oxidoreductase [Hoyosella sp. YIM 151337]MCW4354535.1 SDR family oxidoreductase [Hoyosella sp. YIM 151337]
MRSIIDRFRLDGKVAVITGASSGLGAGFARALAGAGASVVLGARREDALASLASEIGEAGGKVAYRRVDVTDPNECDDLAAAAIEQFGRLDVLVNNAGVGTAVPALREEPGEFLKVIDVNLLGAYWMAQACAKRMQPGASIVNIASILGLIKSYAPQAAYAASKAGVIGLTRDLSQQWSGRRGIRVNAIAPGYFASEMTAEIPNDVLAAFIDQHSTLKRLGQQHELDAAVVFFASDASSYVTGTTLAVDGGVSGH